LYGKWTKRRRGPTLVVMADFAGERLERVRASRQYRDGRFRNQTRGVPAVRTNGLAITREFFFGGKRRLPSSPLPVHRPHETWARRPGSDLRVTWLGHSTTLIESGNIRVLTDPVFGDRVSPVSFAGPKRFHPVPAAIGELPRLDAILVSHDHLDHLCKPSVLELAKLRVPFITSLGVGAHLEAYGVEPSRITELDWWEHVSLLGGDLTFTAVPAHHFSGRGLRDRNATLWSSWVIATARHKLFFSGDTGLHEELLTIGEKLGPFDLTMLEIGAYNQAWGDIHLGPHNALRAFEMLGGGTLLPVHWGTFDLGLHPWDEPAEQLFGLAEASGARILTPMLGRPFEPAHVDAPVPWWRAVRAGESLDAVASAHGDVSARALRSAR
jgi:L-ascorbate metabolism protein UlaG (beta-lactamase superfamily)